MPKYCSQCGMAGHNKRNRICRINVIEKRFQTIVQEAEEAPDIVEKREILRTALLEIRSERDRLKQTVNLERLTSEFYFQQLDDARRAHNLAQHTGPMELCIETYNQLECARASSDIMYRNYTTAVKCEKALELMGMKLLDMYIILTEPQFLPPPPKITSQYLKEMVVVLDITSSVETKEVYDCPLCYEGCCIKDVIQTNCGHSYCVDCMKSFATSIKDKTIEPTCPLCRGTIQELKTLNCDILCDYVRHVAAL